MLEWVRQWKRPAMGWTGVLAILVALFISNQDPTVSLAAITIGLALICVSLSSRTWSNVRAWWTD